LIAFLTFGVTTLLDLGVTRFIKYRKKAKLELDEGKKRINLDDLLSPKADFNTH
jgi:hypothetical protein